MQNTFSFTTNDIHFYFRGHSITTGHSFYPAANLNIMKTIHLVVAAVLFNTMFVVSIYASPAEGHSSIENITAIEEIVGTWDGTCYQSAGYAAGQTSPPVMCLNETLSYAYTITFSASDSSFIWDSAPAYGRTAYYPAYLNQFNEITIDNGSVRLDNGTAGCFFLQRVGQWLVEIGAYSIEDTPNSDICSAPSNFLLECNEQTGYTYYCVYSRSTKRGGHHCRS